MRSSQRPLPTRLRRAIHRTGRIAANALIDLRYGSLLSLDTRRGIRVSRANSDYAALRQMFDGQISPDDVLVDVGCSTGRVINAWLHQGLTNRIIGIEIDHDVAARTRNRLRRFPNVEIVTGNAIEHLPEEGTIFYVFNPFGAPTMAALEKRLRELRANGIRPRVIYYNSKHLDVFDDDRWSVERVVLDAPLYAPLSPLAILTHR